VPFAPAARARALTDMLLEWSRAAPRWRRRSASRGSGRHADPGYRLWSAGT